MNKVDTCGLSCPQPVLMTKKALDKSPEGADIIVDSNVARENVEKFLRNSGYAVSITEEGETFLLEARK
ncbi:MAG: SirA family protein [Tissierellia bacterium]|jgi:TusA-related sulfurtransferase|nr:SirA family protein [Tissierellia bacterium]